MESQGRPDEAQRAGEADRVTMARAVELRIAGKKPYLVEVPVEWSGALTFTVHVHRGHPSGKIFVGRLVNVIMKPDGDHEHPRLEPGDSPALGGAGQEA